jgi:hypothetical protein
MTPQFNLFGTGVAGAPSGFPDGFRYQSEFITTAVESATLAQVRELPFRDFEFHGYTGKRRVVSFGWHYDFGARQLRKADDMPDFLLELRPRAAAFAALSPEAFQHVLVTEYGAGACSEDQPLRLDTASRPSG